MVLLLACAEPSTPGPTSGGADSGTPPTDDSGPPVAACDGTPLQEQAFAAWPTEIAGMLTACRGQRQVTAGAVDTVLSVVLEGDATLSVTDPAGHDLGAGPEVQLWQSGEVFLDVTPTDDADHAYTLSVSCVSGCDARFTRYPVLMMHGFGGAGVFGGVDYFYGVRDVLEAQGYLVRNPSVNPFGTSYDRAEEWATILDGYLAEGLGRKFILLGHSQGGLDARWLVSGLGYADAVAAIDMVGTPNQGTVVADVLGGTIDDGVVDPDIVDLGAAAFAALYGLDDDGSLSDNLLFLTTGSLAEFNARAPDDPDVYYSSWAGVTCGTLEFSCQDERGGEVVEPLLEPLYLIQYAYGLDADGMVDVESAPWGEYLGEIDADHADEIGAFEDTDNPAFDHISFYEDEMARLAALGF
jgi:triacylglycerol lipase